MFHVDSPREAINLFAYGEEFYIKGAYGGKIYHKSYENKKEHLEKFLDEYVSNPPFFTDLYTSKKKKWDSIYLSYYWNLDERLLHLPS